MTTDAAIVGGVRVTAPSTACDSAPEMEKRFDVRALLLSPDAKVVALLLSAPTAKPTDSRFSDAPREGEARGGEGASTSSRGRQATTRASRPAPTPTRRMSSVAGPNRLPPLARHWASR